MASRSPSLSFLFWTFLKIGSTAFGGLMSLIAVVENVVVEKMRLLSHEDILDGISLTTFLPGPISTNVVIYVGYRLKGKWGALVSLLGVILPSFFLIVGLAIIYFKVGEIPTVNNLFLGFIPAVSAIILSTAWQMSRKALVGWRQVTITMISALLLIGVGGMYITIFTIIGSGLVGWLFFSKSNAFLFRKALQNFKKDKYALAEKIDFYPESWQIFSEPKSFLLKNNPENSQKTNIFQPLQHKSSLRGRLLYRKTKIHLVQKTQENKSFEPVKKLQLFSGLFFVMYSLLIYKAFFLKKLLINKNKAARKKRIFISLFLLSCALLAYFTSSLILKKYILIQIFVTFATISVMLFGGAYVGIPLIQEIVVGEHNWLTQQEFTYGLALGQITPGPIVMSAAFIGYKVGNIWGALVATVGVFLPSFLLMIVGANVLESFKKSSEIQAAMNGIRPAVIGMIFAAFWVVGKTASPSWISILIFIVSLLALVRWQINVVWIIPFAGLVGLLFY